jgi:predicted ester cyclase
MTSTVREPKEVVRDFLDNAFSAGDWVMEVVERCFSPEYWSHTWQGDLAHTGARQARFFGAFEYLELVSDDVVAEGDLVVHRSTQRLRHVGEVLGVAPTGRIVTVEHIEMWRVTGGLIVEHWGGLGVSGQLHRALTSPAAPSEPAGG